MDVSGTAISATQALRPTPVNYNTRGSQDFSLKDSAVVEKVNWDLSNREQLDGCNLKGSFPVGKVQGTFQITAIGHGFLGQHTPHELLNFTHRIDELSFGTRYPGLVNPLDKTNLKAQTSTRTANPRIRQLQILSWNSADDLCRCNRNILRWHYSDQSVRCNRILALCESK